MTFLSVCISVRRSICAVKLVLGVSIDPVARLGKFITRDNLNFTLLSDEDHQVAEQFGVWGEKKFTLE